MFKSITYLLLLVLALPNALQLSRLFNYVQHYQEYVSQCENKEKEELQCNGLCKFSQEIQQKDQNQPEKPNLPAETLSFLISALIPDFVLNTPKTDFFYERNSTLYLAHYSDAEGQKLEKPPRFLI